MVNAFNVNHALLSAVTEDNVLFQDAYQAKYCKVMDLANLAVLVREQSKFQANVMENVKTFNVRQNKFRLKMDVNTAPKGSNPQLIEEVAMKYQDVTADSIETLMEFVSLAKIIMFYQLTEEDVRQLLVEQTRKKQLMDFVLLANLVQ